MSDSIAPNHRTTVARNRRVKTRKRLLESAFKVFAEKGVDASVIEDVIRLAGLSRGTFYNYFQSNEALLVAVHDQLRNELISSVKDALTDSTDAAERIALRLGLLLQFARANPLLAQFVAQIGFKAAGPELLVSGHLGRDIQLGIEQGRFVDCELNAALDTLTGGAMVALLRISMGPITDAYAKEVCTTALRALGLSSSEVHCLSTKPLPELRLSPDCLLISNMVQDASPVSKALP